MTETIIFLVVSAIALTWQVIMLLRLLARSLPLSQAGRLAHHGLIRTSSCRVAASSAYVALALLILLSDALPVAALVIFAATQLLWMGNAWLDVRLRQRLAQLGRPHEMEATR